MDKFLEGEIITYCYLVIRGKSAANLPIQAKYLNEAKKIVSLEHELKYYTTKLNKDWYCLWIYQYSHIKEVIKSLPEKPKTIFDHWVLGKLFGYSEDSIQEFISQFE